MILFTIYVIKPRSINFNININQFISINYHKDSLINKSRLKKTAKYFSKKEQKTSKHSYSLLGCI